MKHFALVLTVLAARVLSAFGVALRPTRAAHAITDTLLFFRTSGAASLTATETSAALTINGTPRGGLVLEINIPKLSVGDTIVPTLVHSTDDSTYTTLLTMETVASVTQASTVPTQIRRTFNTRLKYVKLVLTVAGTSPDFGIVNAFISTAPGWQSLGVGQNITTTP